MRQLNTQVVEFQLQPFNVSADPNQFSFDSRQAEVDFLQLLLRDERGLDHRDLGFEGNDFIFQIVESRIHIRSFRPRRLGVKQRTVGTLDPCQFAKFNPMNSPIRMLFAALPALLLLSCSPHQAAPPAPFKPTASIQDLMVSIIDPAADALWESVSSETTATGIEEKFPRTEKEWQAVRNYALQLQEASNLLVIPGRPVTHGGKATEDAHVEGVSTPQQVQQAIDKDTSQYHAAARALQDAAGEALAAIDAKDPARLLVAGGKLDQACERCHSVFWYPNAKDAPVKWPAPIKSN